MSARTLGVSGTGFPLTLCDPDRVFPPLKLRLLACETRPCREAAGTGRWAMHARTQALEPSSRQRGSPGRVGCLGLRAQPGPELPIPLPEPTGEGSESSPLWRRARQAGPASAKGPREGRSLVQVTQGQSWGEPGQPYLVHQQLGIGLDRDADHVGAVDGLPARRVTELSGGGVASGSWTLRQGRSAPLHSRGDEAREGRRLPAGHALGRGTEGRPPGSPHLTVWSCRLRPALARRRSSQVRPWSSRLRERRGA